MIIQTFSSISHFKTIEKRLVLSLLSILPSRDLIARAVNLRHFAESSFTSAADMGIKKNPHSSLKTSWKKIKTSCEPFKGQITIAADDKVSEDSYLIFGDKTSTF